MIQYVDSQTNSKYIDVATLMSIINKNKAEVHRILQLFRVEKISYRNRFLIDYSTVEELIKGFTSTE